MLRRRMCEHKVQDVSLSINAPFDQGLYTSEYMLPDPPAKNFRDGDEAWTRFLAARPLLYLPGRSPVTEEDPHDKRRRLWTHQQLQAFGDVVDQRTRIQLRLQERTLRRWHSSAINIQRVFRGTQGRMTVLRIRQEKFEHAATLERALALARLEKKQNKAAAAIQRVCKLHRKRVILAEQAALVIQRADKLFMHRLRRWRAKIAIQRAGRCFLWRLRWQRHRTLVTKMLAAAARRRQLEVAAADFQRAHEAVLLQRQADTWAAHPERMQMLLRVRRRKQMLRNAGIGMFPPLHLPAKQLQGAKNTNQTWKQRNQQLPPLE